MSSPTQYPRWSYPIIFTGLSLSIIGCLLIVLTYLRSPGLRKHPYSIVYRISLFNLAGTLCLVADYSADFIYHGRVPITEDVVIAISMGIVWSFATMCDFGSLLFHALLSVNLIMNSVAPFSDGKILKRFFKPIYAFSILYPLFRVTLWRYLWYGEVLKNLQADDFAKKSNFPWEGAIGISVIFLIAIIAMIAAYISVKSLNSTVYKYKRGVIIQTAFYVIVFLICWSGPLVFRIYYLLKRKDQIESILGDWNGISNIIVGLFSSIVWMSMDSIKNHFKKSFCCKDNGYDLLENKEDEDFASLSLILRKNLLICTLTGIQYTLNNVKSKNQALSDLGSPQLNDLTTAQIKENMTFRVCSSNIQDHRFSQGIAPIDIESMVDEDLLPGEFSITALSPEAFHNIRTFYGVDSKAYYNSLEPATFLAAAIKNQKFSEGRSGAFFVFSPDKSYILKTMKTNEYEALEKLIPDYYEHVRNNPNTLITPIFGGYKVEIFHASFYVVVMDNLFYQMKIDEIYDLKGSWVERGGNVQASVKKDLDLKNTIQIGEELSQALLQQIKLDTDLLRAHNLVDYSLLVGISPPTELVEHNIESNKLRRIPSPAQNTNYVFGLIDFLQSYNLFKRSEHFLKTTICCKDKQGISIQPPKFYSKRFNKHMSKIIT